jgi:hypothetical protein
MGLDIGSWFDFGDDFVDAGGGFNVLESELNELMNPAQLLTADGEFISSAFPGFDTVGNFVPSIADIGTERGASTLGNLLTSLGGGPGSGATSGLGLGTVLGLGGANVIGGILGSQAAQNAARIQANAGQNAANAQMGMFNSVRGDLLPFQAMGVGALSPLAALTGTNVGGNPLLAPLTRPFAPTMEQLEATPGFQFTRDQGLKAVANRMAAKGLSGSGAEYKGMADYVTGLASTTYNDQLKNTLAQQQQMYNMLTGLVQGGQNAASQTGNFGVQSQSTANNLLTSGAAAQAGGVIGSANALGGIGTNLGNLLMTNSLMQGMFGR